MYLIARLENVIRIPPNKLGEDIDNVMVDIARTEFEGKVELEGSFTILVMNVEPRGEGRIVHGDGGVYQRIVYDALIFKPTLQEVVDGVVIDILKFGAFVSLGPKEGLLHISQILDDRIDFDEANNRLVGRDSKKDLKLDSKVRIRIVAVSINERGLGESKIGLTMRQPNLGRFEWIDDERKKAEKIERKKPEKKKKRKKR
jgi:DNA-directed RNA polymerase subunit E'